MPRPGWLLAVTQWPRQGLVILVRGYQLLLKPWLGNVCRFEPSCSVYAMQALTKHGAAKGTALATWRILRCNPWCEGGCDPVPDSTSGFLTRWLRPNNSCENKLP